MMARNLIVIVAIRNGVQFFGVLIIAVTKVRKFHFYDVDLCALRERPKLSFIHHMIGFTFLFMSQNFAIYSSM